MMRVYLIGGLIAALAAWGWYTVTLIQDNAVTQQANEIAAKTITKQSQNYDRLNTESAKAADDKAKLASNLEKAKYELANLKHTQQQMECDLVNRPDGYFERMRELYDQGRH